MAGNYRSGRKPKPAALRVVRMPDASVPTTPLVCPDLVSADAVALRYWQLYEAKLQPLGVLQAEHSEALATLACVSADYERARKQFADVQFRAFVSEKRANGARIVETPILRRLEHLAQLKTRLLGEFGLTPVMATKLFGKRKDYAPRKWDALSRPREA